MDKPVFYSPATLDQALQVLAATQGQIIAGGTDLVPNLRIRPCDEVPLVNVAHLKELRFINERDGRIEIGALTTYSDIVDSDLMKREAAALVQAAKVVGAPQTRNRGTIGGNIANASPAGDALPPLLVLDAIVHLVRLDAKRSIPLSKLLLGPGQTGIEAGELIHHVSFACLPQTARTAYLRLGNRAGMAISIASAAIALCLDEAGVVEDVRIALGALAPTAFCAVQAESVLIGERLSDEFVEAASAIAGQECAPIDDVRASAAYRRHVASLLVQRGLSAVSERA